MSERSINAVENIAEVQKIGLLTTYAKKLHRYYRVTLQFLNFHRQNFSEKNPVKLPLLEYICLKWF